MKKVFYLLTAVGLLTVVFLACEKEETKLYDFNVNYKGTGTIEEPLSLSFASSEGNPDFRFKYAVEPAGSGIFKDKAGKVLEENVYNSLNARNELFYVGSTLGEHKVELITLNNNFKTENLRHNLSYTINHLNVEWVATIEKNKVVIGEKLPIKLTLGINGADDTAVTFASTYRNVEGAATLENEEGALVVFDEEKTIIPGVYTFYASSAQLGVVNFGFDLVDSNGQKLTAEVSFEVVENDPPTITLVGEDTVIVGLNQPYVEEGATAFDPQDGDLTDVIEIDNTAVDTAVLGSYIVTYSVKDSAGATVEVNREVTVKEIAVETITLTPEEITLAKDEGQSLIVVFDPPIASNQNIEWLSDDKSIADVDQKGKVTGIDFGETIITATSENGKFDTTLVKVIDNSTPVTKVSIDPANLSLLVDGTATFTEIVSPPGATNKTVTWKSDDDSIVSVLDPTKGDIVANAVGETKIFAISVNGVVGEALIQVTAVPIVVTSITFDPDKETLELNKSKTLTPSILPVEATNAVLTWESTDSAIVSVVEGVIKAVGIGSATIKASADGVKGEVVITVKESTDIVVTKVEIVPNVLTLEIGDDPVALTAKISPDEATDDSVTWSSDNDNIATVDQMGNVTPGNTAGSVTITATSVSNTDQNGTAEIKVNEKVVPITNIVLNPKGPITMEVGDAPLTINATVQPENTTEDKTITWTSSNEAAATVSAAGVVSAKAAGKTTITVSAGSISKEIEITVIPLQIEKITVAPAAAVTLNTGEDTTLTATVLPAGVVDKTVEWKSSNPAAATVDENGKVTAVGKGKTNISATSGDIESNKVAVTVKQLVEEIKVTNLTIFNDDVNKQLSFEIDPTNANDKSLSWKSSKTNFATVDNEGRITGVAPGTTVITATANDGSGVIGTATVTVKQRPIPLESIEIIDPQNDILMPSNGSRTLSIKYNPSNATNKGTITWESGNPGVATVDANGKVSSVKKSNVTATSFTITAKSNQAEVANTSISLKVYQSPPTLNSNNGDFYGKPGDVVKVAIEARKVSGSSDVRADVEVRVAKNQCWLKNKVVETNGANSNTGEFTYTIPNNGYAIFSFIRRSFDDTKPIPTTKFNFTTQNTTLSQNMDITGGGVSNIGGFNWRLGDIPGTYGKCN